jgi:hypothetical protein
MTQGHGWSPTISMRGIFTPYSLPAFTGAFDLTPLFPLQNTVFISQKYCQYLIDIKEILNKILL